MQKLLARLMVPRVGRRHEQHPQLSRSSTVRLPEPQEWRPAAERIVSGDPLQRAWNYYSSADGRFSAGIWECAVGKWRVVFTENEFCHAAGRRDPRDRR